MTDAPEGPEVAIDDQAVAEPKAARRREPTSTVGRGKAVTRTEAPSTDHWTDGLTTLSLGDSLTHYDKWETPGCIVSDGAYGVLGFEGDTSDHIGMPEW